MATVIIETCINVHQVRVRQRSDSLDEDLQAAGLPFMERYLSWEQLRRYGRLPLFSVSLVALVSIPVIFFIFAVYNDQIRRLKGTILSQETTGAPLHGLSHVLQQLQMLQVPALTLWLWSPHSSWA